jgi:hypothetical protein
VGSSKKAAVISAVVIALVCMIWVVWGNLSIGHFPHLDAVRAVKKNCNELKVCVEKYGRRHAGQYPERADQLLECTQTNPVSKGQDWLVVKPVHGKSEAIDLALKSAKGQVTYCPVRENDTVSEFYILGTDDDGNLVPGTTGTPMVLTSKTELE